MIAEIKNVLSPSSETMMMLNDAMNACMKFISVAAGMANDGSLLPPLVGALGLMLSNL